MAAAEENILVTRLSPEKSEAVCGRFPESVYHERSRTLTRLAWPVEITGKGTILVMSAGTSDIPVAEEAAVTAGFMGNRVETLYDLDVELLEWGRGEGLELVRLSCLNDSPDFLSFLKKLIEA